MWARLYIPCVCVCAPYTQTHANLNVLCICGAHKADEAK